MEQRDYYRNQKIANFKMETNTMFRKFFGLIVALAALGVVIAFFSWIYATKFGETEMTSIITISIATLCITLIVISFSASALRESSLRKEREYATLFKEEIAEFEAEEKKRLNALKESSK